MEMSRCCFVASDGIVASAVAVAGEAAAAEVVVGCLVVVAEVFVAAFPVLSTTAMLNFAIESVS